MATERTALLAPSRQAPRIQADEESGNLGGVQPLLQGSFGCLSCIRRWWTVSFPLTASAAAIATFAIAFFSAAPPIIWGPAAAAAGAALASTLARCCENQPRELQEQVDHLDHASTHIQSAAESIQTTAGLLHGVAITIVGDKNTLQRLLDAQVASDRQLAQVGEELQATSSKLQTLQPLYTQLQGLLRDATSQASSDIEVAEGQSAASRELAAGISGLTREVTALTTVDTQVHETLTAAAAVDHKLELDICAFTGLVQRLIDTHQRLQSDSIKLQSEMDEARQLQTKNQELIDQVKTLEQQLFALDEQLLSLTQGSRSLLTLLPLLQQHMPAIRAIILPDSLRAATADATDPRFETLSLCFSGPSADHS